MAKQSEYKLAQKNVIANVNFHFKKSCKNIICTKNTFPDHTASLQNVLEKRAIEYMPTFY